MLITFTYLDRGCAPCQGRRSLQGGLQRHSPADASGDAQAAQIDKHGRLQQLLGRHRQRAAAGIAAAEQRGDAVRQSPRCAAPSSAPAGGRLRRHGGDQPLGRGAQHREGAVAGFAQFRDWYRAECRPRTSPNSTPARCGRIPDRPCRAARTPSNGSGRPSSQARASAASNCSKPRSATLARSSSRSRKCR